MYGCQMLSDPVDRHRSKETHSICQLKVDVDTVMLVNYWAGGLRRCVCFVKILQFCFCLPNHHFSLTIIHWCTWRNALLKCQTDPVVPRTSGIWHYLVQLPWTQKSSCWLSIEAGIAGWLPITRHGATCLSNRGYVRDAVYISFCLFVRVLQRVISVHAATPMDGVMSSWVVHWSSSSDINFGGGRVGSPEDFVSTTSITYMVHLVGGQESGVTSTAENNAANIHVRTLAAGRVTDRGLAGRHVDAASAWKVT